VILSVEVSRFAENQLWHSAIEGGGSSVRATTLKLENEIPVAYAAEQKVCLEIFRQKENLSADHHCVRGSPHLQHPPIQFTDSSGDLARGDPRYSVVSRSQATGDTPR
jgi:hypothetical protein